MSAIFAGLPPALSAHPRGVPLRRSVNPHVGEAPHLRTGPRYSKLGSRVSCIGVEDLQAWVDSGAKASTSDPGVATVLPAKRHPATPRPGRPGPR